MSECRVLCVCPGTGHDDVLKAVDLPLVSNDQCRQLHRGSLHISERNICAGGRRNEGVCEVGLFVCLCFDDIHTVLRFDICDI